MRCGTSTLIFKGQIMDDISLPEIFNMKKIRNDLPPLVYASCFLVSG